MCPSGSLVVSVGVPPLISAPTGPHRRKLQGLGAFGHQRTPWERLTAPQRKGTEDSTHARQAPPPQVAVSWPQGVAVLHMAKEGWGLLPPGRLGHTLVTQG